MAVPGTRDAAVWRAGVRLAGPAHVHPGGFALATQHINLWIATANTTLLITSSAVLTRGVHEARDGQDTKAERHRSVWASWRSRAWKWALDFSEHLFPGPQFDRTGPDRNGAQLFFAFYFVATGTHAIHMLIRIGLVGWIAWGAAPVMIGVAAAAFMQVGQASPLSRIFALARLFWLAILFGLGSIDFLLRRDVPAPTLTRVD